MEIRAARVEDGPAIEAVVAAAFGPAEGDRVVAAVRALSDGALRASLVATEHEAVVGHVQLNRGWVDARPRLVEVLVLSPLSVAPARQRSGIGSGLLAAALSEAARLGAPAVFLEGTPDYHRTRGFAAAGPLGFARPSARIPGPAFQVALLDGFEPWMTGPLVYPEAFWATDTVGLRDPLLAELEAAAGRRRCDQP